MTRATIRDCALIISNHPHPASLLETWAFIRENTVIQKYKGKMSRYEIKLYVPFQSCQLLVPSTELGMEIVQ